MLATEVKNSMNMTVEALPENESFIRCVVGAFCLPLNPTIEEINDIKTAVSEAVTNCVVHGYEGKGEGKICVDVILVQSSATIKITDFGIGIENIEQAMQPFYTSKQSEERSGMGFTVMQAFMDEVTVESVQGGGVSVTLTKNICGK